MKKPQLWLEEQRWGEKDGVHTMLRIFYPDGSSEYLNLNKYYDNGNVLFNTTGDWERSHGNDWSPDDYDGQYGNDTEAHFLGYL